MNQFSQPGNHRYNPRMNRYEMQNGCVTPENRTDTGCAARKDNANTGYAAPENGTDTGCARPGQSSRVFPSCPMSGSPARSQGMSGECEGCAGDMKSFPLAMAYVPRQSFTNLNDAHTALSCGTLFSDLNLEFHGRRWNHGSSKS